ncbi:hypothetical protein X777_16275 [Ooceraea biroi]|uniref:Uncharacterized protein n=1 Tax=Ooceraea biroi TaxID=2015173 RepID=A0A026VV15_OOCBI|nr:hypothetical protein X777_16275 [Ooceraea biroi]
MDTVIHGYALHTIYGWSVHLLGALWDSVTNLIIHIANKPRTQTEAPEQEAEQPVSALQGKSSSSEPSSPPQETSIAIPMYPRL